MIVTTTLLPQLVHVKKQNSTNEIDKSLNENEADMIQMQIILEQKHLQLAQLKEYLIQQFKNIEQWKDKQDKIVNIVKKNIKGVFTEMKKIMKIVVSQYQYIFDSLIKQTIEKCLQKIYEKDYSLLMKDRQLDNYRNQINKLKEQINHFNQVCNVTTINNMTKIKQLNQIKNIERLYGNKKNTHHNNSNNHSYCNSKSLSKSTFIDYQVNRTKKDKIQNNSQSKSPGQETLQKRYKQFYQQDKSYLLNKSSTTKKIGFEVQRVLKQDYQNQKIIIDHKKYVKDKIECLKNKNMGFSYDIKMQNIKMQKTFKKL